MPTTQRINYGIDPGDRSLAVAAVSATAEDVPIAVEALSLVLHDGGVAEEKTTTSRLAVRGTKRRERRRLHRSHARRAEFADVLPQHGFPLETDETTSANVREHFGDRANHAGFPYFARAALLDPIGDDQLARHLFVVAVRHIDRHRGWRNPWVRFHTLRAAVGEDGQLQMTPTGTMWNQAVAIALGTQEPRTVGECGALAIERSSGVRPTAHARALAMGGETKASLENTHGRIEKAKTAEELAPLAKHFALPIRPLQHDLLYELLLCAEAQGFADIGPVAEALFKQERPGFNADVVGACELEPDQKRAPEFLPSVQEFVVRGFVANLRVQADGGVRPLSTEEADARSRHLLELTDRRDASIKELEHVLPEANGSRVHLKRGRDAKLAEDEEAVFAGKPPIDRTNEKIGKLPKASPFNKWWRDADRERRELLLAAVT